MTPAAKGTTLVVAGALAVAGTLVLKQPDAAPTPTPAAHTMTLVATPSATTPPALQGPSLPDGCDADDMERAQRYSLTAGYEYLKNDCQDIHAWKAQTRLGILDWLAEHGHDSPLATCDVFIDVDRKISVGDKVLIARRKNGKLLAVASIDDFNHLPSRFFKPLTQNCTADCAFPATIKEQSIDGWLVSSYGQQVLVQIDAQSMTLDRQWQSSIGFAFHGQNFAQTIDPKAVTQTIAFHVPCWRDRWEIVTQ